MKAIAIAGIVLLVVLACVIDIRCSIAKDAGAATEIRRIRGEMAAGAKAEAQQREENLELQIRMLRDRARALNRKGKAAEARQVTAEVIRLSNILEAERARDAAKEAGE
jgi:hypothetical protein